MNYFGVRYQTDWSPGVRGENGGRVAEAEMPEWSVERLLLFCTSRSLFGWREDIIRMEIGEGSRASD